MKEESSLSRRKDDSSNNNNIFDRKTIFQKSSDQTLNAQSSQMDASLNNNDIEADISLKLKNPQPRSKKNAFEYKTYRTEFLDSGLITTSRRTEIVNPIETRKTRPYDLDKQIKSILENEEQLLLKEEKEKITLDAPPQHTDILKNSVDIEKKNYFTKTMTDKQNQMNRAPTQHLIEKPKTLLILRRFFTNLRELTSCKPINQLKAHQYRLLGDKSNFYRESHKFHYDETAKV